LDVFGKAVFAVFAAFAAELGEGGCVDGRAVEVGLGGVVGIDFADDAGDEGAQLGRL